MKASYILARAIQILFTIVTWSIWLVWNSLWCLHIKWR